MTRILNYTIRATEAGWSILKFLKENHYSHSVIVQLKKTERGILVDGTWAYVNHPLKAGELLTIRLMEPEDFAKEISDTAPPIPVVYEDEDLLVVNKPSGMPVHPSIRHHTDTLSHAVFFHAKKRHEQYPYRCINRLDRDTSGLTIIAKNAYSGCVLYEQMRNRAIRRTYYAIAQGSTPKRGTVNAPIARKEASVIERTVDFSSGAHAVTHYETLAQKDGLSFLKLTLETGRTHQIRVHMCHIGHPLVGDFLYNPSCESPLRRQALHAGKLEFSHPVSGLSMQLSAPLPEDMRQFFPNISV